MPIYEYRCQECNRRTSLFLRSYSAAEEAQPRCEHCGSEHVVRLISRVAVLHSEESRLDSLADPSALAGLDENDPRSVGRWMRKMSGEMGEDLGPEFSEVVDRLESGESPDKIEESLGDGGLDPMGE